MEAAKHSLSSIYILVQSFIAPIIRHFAFLRSFIPFISAFVYKILSCLRWLRRFILYNPASSCLQKNNVDIFEFLNFTPVLWLCAFAFVKILMDSVMSMWIYFLYTNQKHISKCERITKSDDHVFKICSYWRMDGLDWLNKSKGTKEYPRTRHKQSTTHKCFWLFFLEYPHFTSYFNLWIFFF